MYDKNLPESHTGVIFENGEYCSFIITTHTGERDGLYIRFQKGGETIRFFISETAIATSQMHLVDIQVSFVKFRNRIVQSPKTQIINDGLLGLSTANIDLIQEVIHTREETDCILGAMLLKMDYVHEEGAITYDVFCDSTELTLNEITERLEYFKSREWIVERNGNSLGYFELTEAGRVGIRALVTEISAKDAKSVGTDKVLSIPEEQFVYDIFICYPSPLKKIVAEPLNNALQQVGLKTWFDKSEIGWGDEFLRRIQDGLLQSRYAVVIIGTDSAGRYYQKQEIQSLQKLESSRKTKVLPLLHEVSIEQFTDDFPFLSNKLALSTDLSFDKLAANAKQIVDQSRS